MAFSYQYVTLAQAQSDLGDRLYDAGIQWPGPELTLYIQEALRTWNAFTSFWRGSFTFNLAGNSPWYDITNPVLNSIRQMTVTDGLLLQQIEAHFLEPISDAYPLGAWTGSAQFSFSDIIGAIQDKRDETLSSTGCTLTRLTPAPVAGKVVLPDTVLTIRRVAWLPDNNNQGFVATPLHQSDVWASRAFDTNWTSSAPSVPTTWVQSSDPPLSFDVTRIPPYHGLFEVLTVNAGNALVATQPTVLGVPDDWSWVIKWGAMTHLLGREGLAKDPLREQYCEQRYQQGLELMRTTPALLELRVNNQPMPVDSVTNGDAFNPGWQGAAPAQPQSCYTAGLNLIAFAPMPGPVPGYTAFLSVIQNAPVPVNQGDYLQVARSDYDSVMDYAQHLAMFKAGGAEFAATIPLYQSFVKRAAQYNSQLSQMGAFQKPIYEISQLEEERNPTMAVDNG